MPCQNILPQPCVGMWFHFLFKKHMMGIWCQLHFSVPAVSVWIIPRMVESTQVHSEQGTLFSWCSVCNWCCKWTSRASSPLGHLIMLVWVYHLDLEGSLPEVLENAPSCSLLLFLYVYFVLRYMLGKKASFWCVEPVITFTCSRVSF